MKQSLRTLLQIVAILTVICTLPCMLNAQGPPSFLYTNDNIPNGANTVTAFSIGPSGALTQIGSFPTGGTGAGSGLYASNRVKIGAVGSFLYVTDDGSNDVAGFSINPTTGGLTAVTGSPFATGGNAGTNGGLSLAVTPDGKFLIAGSAGSTNITVFSIASDGSLTPISGSPFPAGAEPDGTRVTPDGAFLTVGLAAPVGVYSIASNGVLAAAPGSPFAGSGSDAGVDVSCAGNRLFAGNAGATTVIDVFNIALNGALSPIPGSPFRGSGVNSNVVLLSPNNQFLFVSNQGTQSENDTVSVFSVASNGSLAEISGSPFHVNSGLYPSLIATDQAGTLLFTANAPLTGQVGASIGAFTIASNGFLTAVTGSPFSLPGSAVESIAVFPSATCTNPVPLVNQPFVPDATPAGGSGFTLTVNGTGFVSSSVVNWNGTSLTTTFVTRNQLTATVPSSDLATASTASVTVINPAPGGGTSNVVPFTVTSPTNSISLTSSTVGVGVSPYYVAVADFNGDGKPDLAVVNNCGTDLTCASPGTVSILLGNGDGTFTTKSTPSVDLRPVSAAAGDFNGDGKLDLAVVNNCPTCEGGSVSILIGNGDGTFTTGTPVSTGSTPGQAIAADFNGDGKLDLAVTSHGNDTVNVFLGNGDATFTFGSALQLSAAPTSLVSGDFNGDGILDLAVALDAPNGGVTILLGNGDGTFTLASSQPFTGLVAPQSVTAGDFNGDGILDLALTDAGSGRLLILQGNGDGTFRNEGGLVTSQYSRFASAADFNGDEKLDLAVVGFCDGLTNCTPVISIYLGSGNGQLQPGIDTAAGNLPLGLGFGDFNADGRLDLVVANSQDNTVSILLQSPVASLSPPALAFGNQPLNTTSAPQPVTLTNTGSATLSITSISVGGANSTDFAQTNNCGPQLAAGANCIIDVTFTPTATGSRSGSLAVSDNASGSPQTVSLSGVGTKNNATPPAITTQPASQNINSGQTATLSVVATGTLPLSYQWYQGKSPDTSNLIVDATGSSFTTPALTTTTSFWVKVSNTVGSVNSNTATITVNQGPMCKLTVQGFANPLEFDVTANCSDAVATITSTTIDWGDGTPTTSGTSGSHTYASAGEFTIAVTAIDSLGLVGSASESMTAIQQPSQSVFAGQSASSQVTVIPPAQSVGVTVTFDCATVTGPSLSAPVTPESMGISCSSPPVKLGANANTVSVTITTTGSAAALLSSPLKRLLPLYAVWLPLPGFLFLGLGVSSRGPNRRKLSRYLTLAVLSVLVVLCVSCGGGFTAPQTSTAQKQTTPAGTYFVTVVDTPVQGTPTGFVQTSLIVPLTVSATQ